MMAKQECSGVSIANYVNVHMLGNTEAAIFNILIIKR